MVKFSEIQQDLMRNNTNYDQLTPWLRSTKPKCLRLNTTFYAKMGTFEAVCIYPPPCFVTTDYTQHKTTVRAGNGLVLMQTIEFCQGCVAEFLSMFFLRQAFILRE